MSLTPAADVDVGPKRVLKTIVPADENSVMKSCPVSRMPHEFCSGKFEDEVLPATQMLPDGSAAIACCESPADPPNVVLMSTWPSGETFITYRSAFTVAVVPVT